MLNLSSDSLIYVSKLLLAWVRLLSIFTITAEMPPSIELIGTCEVDRPHARTHARTHAHTYIYNIYN